jgi:hypothetical protein
MTILSNAGPEEVTLTAVSQVGYTNGDGFGWDENGLGFSTAHERGEQLYIVPGTFSAFYIQQITALTPLNAPADNFVWMEGPAFLQFIDNTLTWQTAAAQEDIQSWSVGATLALNAGSGIPAPAPVGEGVYTLHVGFDLIRDNQISEFDVHYVDFARTVVFGPKPSIFITDTSLTVGDPGTGVVGLSLLAGTSTTPVDVYLTAVDALGVARWWDSGAGQWATGLASPIFPSGTVTVDILPSPFVGAVVAGATNYPIADGTQVGTHTFNIIYDRSTDNVLNDAVFIATDTVEVVPAP